MLVAYPQPASDEVLRDLENQVPGLRVTREVLLDIEVLIEGRPTAEMLSQCPRVKAVIVPFAGVPKATAELLRSYPSISLHNLHHNAPETAETAVALLLAAAKRLPQMDAKLRKGDWTPRYQPSQTLRLEGKTALILGYGEIGRRIERSLQALGVNTVVVRRSKSDGAHGIDELDELLPKADILMIALPLTADTEGLLDERRLGLLPEDCVLVNIARGPIVGEQALYEALESGRLFAAGLDVWYQYPQASPKGRDVSTMLDMPESATHSFPSKYPFHQLDNVVMSPHRAGSSKDVERHRIADLARLIRQFANGEQMDNRVDIKAGY